MLDNSNNNSIPPVPEGTRPLRHQVAGRVFGKGKTKLGFLQAKDGNVLKPIHQQCNCDSEQLQRRQTELNFYERVFDPDCDEQSLILLRPFLPAFLGTWTAKTHPGVTFLHLEDVTCAFHKPCIIDIKMGCVTHGPDADLQKIAHRKLKYPNAAQLGFQFMGMRVYESEVEDYVSYDRTFLTRLSVDELYEKAFTKYLRVSSRDFDKNVVCGFIKRLRSLQQWFGGQQSYSFIATSLLLVYEGLPNQSDICHEDIGPLTDIRMIDVNRVYSTSNKDTNYMTGLSNLISFFQRVLQRESR